MTRKTPLSQVQSFKFSECAKEIPDMTKAIKAETCTVEEFLASVYSSKFSFSIETLLNNGQYRLLGYSFDFSPWLNKYLAKTGYYGWKEYYSPNKALLRKQLQGQGKVYEIRNY